jgi:hypothetical protein
MPFGCPKARRVRRLNVITASHATSEERNMSKKPEADNTELERDFEPLRVTLALGALILGVLFGLH